MQPRTTPSRPLVLCERRYAQPAVSPLVHAPTSFWMLEYLPQEESLQQASSDAAQDWKIQVPQSFLPIRGDAHDQGPTVHSSAH